MADPFGFSFQYGSAEYGDAEFGQLTAIPLARAASVPVEFVGAQVQAALARSFGTPVEFTGVTVVARRFGLPVEIVAVPVSFLANWLAAGGGAPVWWDPDIYAQQMGYTSRGTYRAGPQPGLRIHTRARKGVRVRASAPPAPQAALFAPQMATFTARRTLPGRVLERAAWAPQAPARRPAPPVRQPAPPPPTPVYEVAIDPVSDVDKRLRENADALLLLL